jgi:hypothetical protein
MESLSTDQLQTLAIAFLAMALIIHMFLSESC